VAEFIHIWCIAMYQPCPIIWVVQDQVNTANGQSK